MLARPDLSARVSDIDHADVVLVVETELVDEAPILDLRVRKAARRNGTKVVTLTSRPGTLEPNAAASVRFAPGAAEAALGRAGRRAGLRPRDRRAAAGDARRRRARTRCARPRHVLRGAGDVVVLWGERVVARRPRRPRRGGAAGGGAARWAWRGSAESGLIEVPAATNARGMREAGVLPNLGPGLADAPEAGMAAAAIARALADGDLTHAAAA